MASVSESGRLLCFVDGGGEVPDCGTSPCCLLLHCGGAARLSGGQGRGTKGCRKIHHCVDAKVVNVVRAFLQQHISARFNDSIEAP